MATATFEIRTGSYLKTDADDNDADVWSNTHVRWMRVETFSGELIADRIMAYTPCTEQPEKHLESVDQCLLIECTQPIAAYLRNGRV